MQSNIIFLQFYGFMVKRNHKSVTSPTTFYLHANSVYAEKVQTTGKQANQKHKINETFLHSILKAAP